MKIHTRNILLLFLYISKTKLAMKIGEKIKLCQHSNNDYFSLIGIWIALSPSFQLSIFSITSIIIYIVFIIRKNIVVKRKASGVILLIFWANSTVFQSFILQLCGMRILVIWGIYDNLTVSI